MHDRDRYDSAELVTASASKLLDTQQAAQSAARADTAFAAQEQDLARKALRQVSSSLEWLSNLSSHWCNASGSIGLWLGIIDEAHKARGGTLSYERSCTVEFWNLVGKAHFTFFLSLTAYTSTNCSLLFIDPVFCVWKTKETFSPKSLHPWIA